MIMMTGHIFEHLMHVMNYYKYHMQVNPFVTHSSHMMRCYAYLIDKEVDTQRLGSLP